MMETQDIASPKQCGDNKLHVDLGDGFRLEMGYWETYYLGLYAGNQMIYSMETKDKIWYSKKAREELIEILALKRYKATKKEVKSAILSLFSELAPKFSDLDNRVYYRNYRSTVTNNTANHLATTSCFLESKRKKALSLAVSLSFDEKATVVTKAYKLAYGFTNKAGDLLLCSYGNSVEVLSPEQQAELNIIPGIDLFPTMRWSETGIQMWETKGTPRVDSLKLFNSMLAVYNEYVEFQEPEMAKIHVLWDIGTYLFILFKAYPYFNMWGLRGSGKTKVMEVSKLFALNGIQFVNMSQSSLFRIVHSMRPTLYIDEAEKLFEAEGDDKDVLALLNAGWMEGSQVPRVNQNDSYKLEMFNVYCPKMFASIKGLQGALADRCITEIMVKTRDGPKGDSWPQEDGRISSIRDDIYAWAMQNYQVVMFMEKQLKKEFNVSNRDWQIWMPLLCIAKIIDEGIYQEVGKFAQEYSKTKHDVDDDGWDTKIVNTMLDWVKDEEESKYYISELQKIMEHMKERKEDSLPSASYIGRFLNKIGMKKWRKRDKKNYYLLTRKRVLDIIGRHYEIDASYLPSKEEFVKQEEVVK